MTVTWRQVVLQELYDSCRMLRMRFSERTRIAATLSVFAAVFIALAVGNYTRKSATWDEPQHLTAGYASLTRLDFRIDSEHPPFARMWAALPLAFSSGI